MAANGFNIIIAYHGQYTTLRECIGSIFLQTRNVPFKITVVDDGSPNKGFFDDISRIDSQIDGIRLDEQKGLGAALNEAIKLTTEPWLVFLNSDCIIHELDWLLELYQALESNMKNKVGLVSSTMNNGGNCTAIERVRTDPRKNAFTLANEPMPLICAMAPRKLFDRVGLFKEYPYGWYEDEEFFWRMKTKGYKQGFCEKSWIEHKGGLTTQALWEANPNIKKIMMEENQKKCAADIKKIVIN
jgi:GT2 family glycosyltransferase